MKPSFKSAFLVGFLAVAWTPVSADTVVYSNTVTTNFKWHWPQQTIRTIGYTQTQPYHTVSRLIVLSNEDFRKYRFHYRQKASTNPWGYFFKPTDKLGSRISLNAFGAPLAYQQSLVIK
jgi:hypothetical protein